MRRECHGRSDRAGKMCEVDVLPLSEVNQMDAENHESHHHAKRGKGMGSDGPELKRDEMVCARAERENDALDEETRDELGEYSIYSPILCYKVIRLCGERKMLGLLRLVVRRGVI